MKLASITFDDGFESAAATSLPILDHYGFAATFYVVTGWVAPVRAEIRDLPNIGRSHGTWGFWREVADLGHEVGSHGFSHVNAGERASRYLPWIIASEVGRSAADLAREVPSSGYTISMPWNAASRISDFCVRRRFLACRLGHAVLQYNRLSDLSPYALRSWAVGPGQGWRDFVAAVENLPQDGWLIVQLHSFGSEGWAPISPAMFDGLCELLQRHGVAVRTVREVVQAWGHRRDPA